ncbi:MAG: DUF1501 domain-containing protein [Chloroflexi bacterium]|nr:DUF1501 domain-containing protein [Chloroflexota bacterium]
MTITRRQFLKSSLAAAPAAAIMPAVFSRAVAAAIHEQSNAPKGNRTLIIVQMAGGNDGLNTIVPTNDGAYYDVRPTVNVEPGVSLPLNNDVGLNPSLTAFKELWDEGTLAVVEGVGYPNPNYSHFASMDVWQTADPSASGFEGWVGRYLEGVVDVEADKFVSMAVGRKLPREMFTHKVSIPVVDTVDAYQIQPDPFSRYSHDLRTGLLLDLYASSPGARPFGALFDDTMKSAESSSSALQTAHADYTPAVDYPETRLGQSMKVLAGAIIGNLGVRVGHVRTGGFDLHATQLPDHGGLLADVADSIATFYRDLQAHGRDQDVVIMTWSEFGRRVTENGSGGTDHGSAGPMFIAGTPVSGGLYGERPSLTDLDNNNFKFTTDFRQVYASLLEGWLGAPSDIVLNGRFEQLPLLRPDATAS